MYFRPVNKFEHARVVAGAGAGEPNYCGECGDKYVDHVFYENRQPECRRDVVATTKAEDAATNTISATDFNLVIDKDKVLRGPMFPHSSTMYLAGFLTSYMDRIEAGEEVDDEAKQLLKEQIRRAHKWLEPGLLIAKPLRS